MKEEANLPLIIAGVVALIAVIGGIWYFTMGKAQFEPPPPVPKPSAGTPAGGVSRGGGGMSPALPGGGGMRPTMPGGAPGRLNSVMGRETN